VSYVEEPLQQTMADQTGDRQPISPQGRELQAVRESIKLAHLKKASLDQRLWTYLRGKMATAGTAEEAAAPLTSLSPKLTSGGSGSDDDWMVISSGSSSSVQTAPRSEGVREDASLTGSDDDELEQEQIRADDNDDDGLVLEDNDSEGEDGLCLEDNPNEEDAALEDNLTSDGDDGLCLEENEDEDEGSVGPMSSIMPPTSAVRGPF
jgi:hypothetical protein